MIISTNSYSLVEDHVSSAIGGTNDNGILSDAQLSVLMRLLNNIPSGDVVF